MSPKRARTTSSGIVPALVLMSATALGSACGQGIATIDRLPPPSHPHAPSDAGIGGAAASSGTSTSSAGGSGGASSSGSAGGAGAASSSGSAGGAGGASIDAGLDASADAGGSAPSDAGDASACATSEILSPPVASPHLPLCIPIAYATNPPTSGPHYPVWAAFKTYTTPLPWGFMVHDLEHGAIVISYNCADCAADVAALQAYVDALAPDPLCAAPLKNRIVIVPEPSLDVKFAASAWGALLRSSCFDLPALGTFIQAHYAQGPENFCVEGSDLSAPGAIPAGCGEISDAGASDASDGG